VREFVRNKILLGIIF